MDDGGQADPKVASDIDSNAADDGQDATTKSMHTETGDAPEGEEEEEISTNIDGGDKEDDQDDLQVDDPVSDEADEAEEEGEEKEEYSASDETGHSLQQDQQDYTYVEAASKEKEVDQEVIYDMQEATDEADCSPERMDQDGGEDEHDENGEEIQWVMCKVFTETQLKKGTPMCVANQDEPCPNMAAVVYANAGDPKDKYNYCLDCQDADFEGWPETGDEIPIDSISEEHFQLMKEKCSSEPNPSMPLLLTSTSCGIFTTGSKKKGGPLVTPPPNQLPGSSSTNKIVVHMAKEAKKSGNSGGKDNKQPPSKAAQAAFNRWRETADKLGGKGEKLLIKPNEEAKQKIFDVLKDTFRPHTMTEIHNVKLKGTIPAPNLNLCLSKMSLADQKTNDPFGDDSDDDDDDSDEGASDQKYTKSSKFGKAVKTDKKEDKDPFAACLIFKPSNKNKNENKGIYYVDHTLLPEMTREEREELAAKIAQVNNEVAILQSNLMETQKKTAQLLSEPTNDELDKGLAEAESDVTALEDQVVEARKFLSNEKVAEKTKKKIQGKCSFCRESFAGVRSHSQSGGKSAAFSRSFYSSHVVPFSTLLRSSNDGTMAPTQKIDP